MADKMPAGLREYFEKKNGKEGGDMDTKMTKRSEALRKAKKAKAKREMEKSAKS